MTTLQTRAGRSKLRLHGTIARDLGVRIVSGRYKPGASLENEIDASQRLKVSRSAYREAIRILNAKGLVRSRPKTGTRVSHPESWHMLDPDVLSWIFEFDPDEKLLSNLFELRKMIEPEAAALAARRRTPAQLQTMRQALDGMASNTLENEAGRMADRVFHSTLLDASGNAFLISLTSGIAAAINWTTVLKQRRNLLPPDPVPDHERVYRAIKTGAPQAARKAMAKLIDLAYQDMKRPRR